MNKPTKKVPIISSLASSDGAESKVQKSLTTTHILASNSEPTIAVHRFPANGKGANINPPILYIHGATFSGELSVGFKLEDQSWADDLNERGFDVWALSFAGYGQSDNYAPANRHIGSDRLPGRSREVQPQVLRAVRLISDQTSYKRISIISHSWGTIAAGEFAANNPSFVKKLVLFGPIAQRNDDVSNLELPQTRFVSIEDQYDRFISDTPDEQASVLHEQSFQEWAKLYLRSDRNSSNRSPPSVEIPSGPSADIGLAWTGAFPYDPTKIKAATLIIRGEWDSLSTDKDAAWLSRKLRNTEILADVKIPKGGHLMHLESGRFTLWEEVGSFLNERIPKGEKQ